MAVGPGIGLKAQPVLGRSFVFEYDTPNGFLLGNVRLGSSPLKPLLLHLFFIIVTGGARPQAAIRDLLHNAGDRGFVLPVMEIAHTERFPMLLLTDVVEAIEPPRLAAHHALHITTITLRRNRPQEISKMSLTRSVIVSPMEGAESRSPWASTNGGSKDGRSHKSWPEDETE